MANLLIYLWITLMFFKAKGSNICLKDNQEESHDISPRGYGYGGFGYPFLPFLEPLSILAVLGFIAFIVQTFHAVYHTHNANSGVGGLLNNVLPSHHKKMQSESRQNENILQAIQYYETINEKKKNKKRKKFAK